MTRVTFENFEFNTQSYSLTQDGAPVSLRPKTAKLLALFVANRGKVLSKAQIIGAVWENDHVPEYALHQLVSELRKLAKDKVLVRTQPNEGYCWVAETDRVESVCRSAQGKTKEPQLFWRYVAGATFAACLMIAIGKESLDNDGQIPPALPGMHALARGVIALDKGDKDAAIAWFEFVLAENPDASQARLLLAEALLQQKRLQEALTYSLPLLRASKDTGLSPSEYDKMAAAELISRIHQRSGQYSEALEFARQSLITSRAQCTVEYLDGRVRELAELTGQMNSDVPQQRKDELARSAVGQAQDYREHCQRLRSRQNESEAAIHSRAAVAPAQWAVIQPGTRRGITVRPTNPGALS